MSFVLIMPWLPALGQFKVKTPTRQARQRPADRKRKEDVSEDPKDTQGQWVTVSSFYRPEEPEAGFEDILACEEARWADTARQAGLAPKEHVRVRRGEEEVTIEVSLALDAAFTPVQTLWKAQ